MRSMAISMVSVVVGYTRMDFVLVCTHVGIAITGDYDRTLLANIVVKVANRAARSPTTAAGRFE